MVKTGEREKNKIKKTGERKTNWKDAGYTPNKPCYGLF